MTVYFASHYSFRLAVVTTLGCSLLLQLGYFASVLFLISRSSCAVKAEQSSVFDRSQEVRYQSPDDDERKNETQDGPSAIKRSAYCCSSLEAL
ncbi:MULTISPECIES: exopolysaccharide production repressor protein [unclassified Mesorhizobium]|uniref:exopolysaccharide production repressor protein n=1 Tax=unclassified Mesorhizobium TaxID=325217 RepID=UPI001FDEAC17|nr:MULTISPECIES: exopolysaccharide production repressor protein [unclassified Mesorhizobium]